MAYSNSSKSQSPSYRNPGLQRHAGKNGTNLPGTAARNRRKARRQCQLTTSFNPNSKITQMRLDNSLFNEELAVMRASQNNWKAQVTKYSLDMFQWVLADLLELSSYWEEDKALASRLSGYDKVAFYQLMILASLEAKKPSIGKKVWDFLNKEVSMTPLAEGVVITAISLGIAAPVAVMATAHTEPTVMNPCIMESPLCRTIIK